MDIVRIFDTTLRDGEQSPGFSMSVPEKVRMAHQLESLGVDIIESGFPIASAGDLEGVRAVCREIRGCTVAALARASAATVHPRISRQTARTPSRSPAEAIGKPLSMMSTPSDSSW